MDTNVYYSNWNCKYTASNCRRFHNALETADFLLHNDNFYAYIKEHKNFNCNIDL